MHVFVATSWEGEPYETEEMAPQWFKLTDIPYAEMWPDDKHWLPQVLAGKMIRATFMLDDNDVITDSIVSEVEAL